MSKLIAFSSIFLAVYLSALPFSCIFRRILVKTFPPNCIIIIVNSNVCEDSILHSRSKCIVVGLSICTRSNAEESVFWIDSIKSAVFALLHPSDIVTYCKYFIAVLLIAFRRNKHSKVCLSASRWESSCNIFNFAVRLLNAEDKHMFSHPAFILTLIGSDSECETLFAEKYITAVSRID